jgi:MscS family membrane protein
MVRLLTLLMVLCSANLLWAQFDSEKPSGNLATPQEVAHQHIYYLDPSSKHYNVDSAAAALVGDIRKVTPLLRERAIKLKQILDGRGLIVREDLIPDNPDFIDSISGNAVYVPFPSELPEIYITKPLVNSNKRIKKYANYWRYDPASVAAIPELHRSVYPLGSHLLLELVPKGGHKLLGLEAWQYLAILVLLLLAFVLNFIVWRLLNILFKFLANTRLGRNHFDEQIVRKIAHLISYIVVAYIIFIFVPVLMLPVGLSFYLLAGLRIFNTICAVLIVLNVIELTRSYFQLIVDRTESKSDDQLLPIFIKGIKILVIVIGAIHVLDVFKVDLTALIAGLSIGGLALALAAQDTVKHVIGSVMIYLDRPFELGDFVTSGGVSGTVEEIGFRSTRIRTVDSSLISIPNGALVDMTVDNMGKLRYRRFNTSIGVAYYTPPALIERFIEGLRALTVAHPQTKSDVYHIYLNNMGGSSLDILFIVFFETTEYAENLRLREEMLFSILKLAEALNVHIAFPSTSVYVESTPEQSQIPAYTSSDLEKAEQDMQAYIESFKQKYEKQQEDEDEEWTPPT